MKWFSVYQSPVRHAPRIVATYDVEVLIYVHLLHSHKQAHIWRVKLDRRYMWAVQIMFSKAPTPCWFNQRWECVQWLRVADAEALLGG